MNRRSLLKGMGSAVAAMGLSRGAWAEKGAKRPPNVVFILPDEWRGQALGCMGNADVQTPHLDGLAAEGVLLRNTLANTPVCCPARASILTGMYTSRTGMVANDLRLDEAEISLGDLFGRAGYRTGFIGKWHLDGGPREPGFVPPGRRRHGFEYWAANECNHNYFYNWYFRDANVPIVSEKYEPEFWTDLAVEFLHESKDRPFFLMLAPGAPHDPYIAPQKYLDLYDPGKLTMEPNWVEGVAGASRREIAGYYAAITAIDDQVGRLLRTLKELDLEENTIVFFSSDHGNMLGSQGMILKRKPWEESIRVPGIMRCPGLIPAGRRTDALFAHVDFAPTLLSLCGLPAPGNMQGSDLAEMVAGKREKGPDAAYFQIFGPYRGDGVAAGWRGIRTERHMYARWETGPWVLYDLERDPYELNNLAGDPAAAALRSELDRKLKAWMESVGDSWSLDWTAPVEEDDRLYKYRTFHTVAEYLEWAAKHPNLAPAVGRN
jgi:arylsulfatase A-like enzyme